MLTLENKAFEDFMAKFKKGEYGQQRLGQAFYNTLNLHKLADQEQLHNIWDKDGEHALNSIKSIFTFN